jgi:hypothetical protein
MANVATEYYYIPELDKEGKRARLAASTDTASSGGLSSSVQMQFADQVGSNFSFVIFKDFSKIVLRNKALRGT